MKPKYILYDPKFEKKFNKFKTQLSARQRANLKKKMELFSNNIFDKQLKTHKLKGKLSSYYVLYINHSDRIVFKILDDNSVYLIEIGSHDVCY